MENVFLLMEQDYFESRFTVLSTFSDKDKATNALDSINAKYPNAHQEGIQYYISENKLNDFNIDNY